MLKYEFIKAFAHRNRWIYFLIAFVAIIVMFLNIQINQKNEFHKKNTEYINMTSYYSKLEIKDAFKEINDKIELKQVLDQLEQLKKIDDMSIEDIIVEIKKTTPELYEQIRLSQKSESNIELMELSILKHISSELKYVNSYSAYMDEIQNRKEKLLVTSIFSNEESYVYKNIIKTANDFSNLRDLEIYYSPSDFIESFVRFRIDDIAIAIMVLLLAVFIFSSERDNGYIILQHATINGKRRLRFTKLIAYYISIIVIVVIVNLVMLILAYNYYNIGDMSVAIQSFIQFKECILHINLWQYIVLHISMQILVMCFFGSIAIFVLTRVSKSFTGLTIVIGILAIEYLLYFLIPNSEDSYVILKYVNIAYFFDIGKLLASYQNVNLFKNPVNVVVLSIYLEVISVLLLSVCVIILPIKHLSQSKNLLSKKIEHVNIVYSKLQLYTSIFAYELKKMLVINFGLFGLIIYSIILFAQMNQNPQVYDSQMEYYNAYMEKWEGIITDDKRKQIDDEKLRFVTLEMEYLKDVEEHNTGIISDETFSNKQMVYKFAISNQEAFDLILTQLNEMDTIRQSKGIDVQLVNQYHYKLLLQLDNQKVFIINAIVLLFILIFLVTPLYAYDSKNNITNLIRSTKLGRINLFGVKIKLICMVIFILLGTKAGLMGYRMISSRRRLVLTAPIQSIIMLKNVTWKFSILEFTIYSYCIQFIGLFLIAMIVLYISMKVESIVIAAITSSSVVLLPFFVSLLNIKIFEGYPLFAFYNPSLFFINQSFLHYDMFIVSSLVITIGIIIVIQWKTIRR